jgi:hypothetical protein
MKQTRNLDAHPPGADQEMSPDQGSPDEGCASRPSGWFAIDNSFFYGGWAAQAGPSAALVYSAIVMHANRETRRAWPSYNRLQSLTGLSRPTVGKCIKELARLGLIRVETRNGGRRQDAAFSRNGAQQAMPANSAGTAEKAWPMGQDGAAWAAFCWHVVDVIRGLVSEEQCAYWLAERDLDADLALELRLAGFPFRAGEDDRAESGEQASGCEVEDGAGWCDDDMAWWPESSQLEWLTAGRRRCARAGGLWRSGQRPYARGKEPIRGIRQIGRYFPDRKSLLCWVCLGVPCVAPKRRSRWAG